MVRLKGIRSQEKSPRKSELPKVRGEIGGVPLDHMIVDARLTQIRLELNMPPSVNALYIKRQGGGVALSKAANQYREHVKKVISSRMAELSIFPAGDCEVIYSVDLECHFENLENPGWFERYSKDTHYTKGKNKGQLKAKAGDRKAATRYKKIDVDNRVKFVQDCVVKGLGIPDDSQVFEGTQRKVQAKGKERVVVTIRVVSPDRFFHGWGR